MKHANEPRRNRDSKFPRLFPQDVSCKWMPQHDHTSSCEQIGTFTNRGAGTSLRRKIKLGRVENAQWFPFASRSAKRSARTNPDGLLTGTRERAAADLRPKRRRGPGLTRAIPRPWSKDDDLWTLEPDGTRRDSWNP